MNRLAIAAVILLSSFATAQNVQLPTANANVHALIEAHSKLLDGITPFDLPNDVFSPDSDALGLLADTCNSATGDLRSAIDLFTVYDNLKSDTDRAMMKPLLNDRLRLYARLLDLEAEKATIPLQTAKQPATSKKALQIHDVITLAKAKLDALVLSLAN